MGINEKIQNYIDEVCSHIKNNKIHEDVEMELRTHIEDIIYEYETSGHSKDEAVDRAIDHMGDAAAVGNGLNRVHKTKPDWVIIILTAVLINLGLIAMYFVEKSSQSLVISGDFWMRSIVYTLVGVVIAFGTYFLDYRSIKKYSKYIYLGTILFFFISFIYSNVIKGTRQWIAIGWISFNFVQLSLFLFIVSIAGIFDNYNWSGGKNVIKGIAIILFPSVLALTSQSLAPCIVYTISAFAIMLLSGVKLRDFLLLLGGYFGLFFMFVMTEPYRIARMLVFVNPNADPEGAGWIYNQLIEIREASGLLGNGVNSNMINLPDIHTDFMLSYIIYTFGWLATVLVITLIIVFLVRMVGIAKGSKDSYGKLLVGGFIAMLTVEFLWNILMNLGVAPTIGVSMPFISYGGSQMIINMMIVGIVINVYKFKNTPVKEKTQFQ